MNEIRFKLERYKGRGSRYTCPQCSHKKSFTRYIDMNTGAYVHERVGRCNREEKCGYHYSPKQFFNDTGMQTLPKLIVPPATQNVSDEVYSFIEPELFVKSHTCYSQNNFVQFVTAVFGSEKGKEIVQRYYIGTSKLWPGACVFWQIDAKFKVRSGKIMLYDVNTGKRVKEPYNHISWVHKVCDLKDFQLRQCFFGEHLLPSHPDKMVAIVESEKTAIIASIVMPNFVWLASGSKNGLSEQKIRVLKGRRVLLYPDAGSYTDWKERSNNIRKIADVFISDTVEKVASEMERLEGYDIADYLIKQRA